MSYEEKLRAYADTLSGSEARIIKHLLRAFEAIQQEYYNLPPYSDLNEYGRGEESALTNALAHLEIAMKRAVKEM